MKKQMRRWISGCLALLLMLQMSAVFAKSETVYFMLDRRGEPVKTVVVNSFIDHEGDIVDYGHYEKIENLSSSSAPKVDGDRIVFENDGDSAFYYRGELKDAVNPWKIEITYLLNGEEVDPETLPQASGDFEMRIRVSENTPDSYADSFTVQMQGVVLGGVSEIHVENGSLVAIGSQYTVASLFIPEQEHVVTVKAKINGLELGAFTFTGVKASLDVDFDFEVIERQIDELVDASSMVLGGLVMLESGAATLSGGIADLSGGLWNLSSAAAKLEESIAAFEGGLKQLGGIRELSGGVKQLLAGLVEANEQMAQLKEIAGGLLEAPDPSMAAVGQALLGQMELNEKTVLALQSLDSGLDRYLQGIQSVTGGYAQLQEGLGQYFAGVRSASGGAHLLSEGAKEYAAGFGEIISGQKEFVAGVGEAQSKFDEAMRFIRGSKKEAPGSYVHAKNEVESVTFVMRTEELRKPVPERQPLPPLPKKSLLGKLMNLFGIEWD